LALGDNAVAITGVSPSLADGELNVAQRIAAQIGIRHRLIETREMQRDDYRRNDERRCFHCKSELYSQIARLQNEERFAIVLSGANLDDLSDYRPGLQAASEFPVRHPLAECGIGKSDVRKIARWWGLEIWDKPASPCLSSRIAYGVEVSEERLRRIDAAEALLRARGFGPLRVRLHPGELARIELPIEQISRLIHDAERTAIADALSQLGFRFVSLDLAGFHSGGLNTLLPIEVRASAVASPSDQGNAAGAPASPKLSNHTAR
jgi:uncharacterized protein